MGFVFSRIFDSLAGQKEVRILILGLDNAGKTTLLYKMKLNDTIHATPSFYFLITLNIKPFAAIGVNVENMEYKNIKFQAWDVGGQVGIRPYWRTYYKKTNAIIYMLDSLDRDRVQVSRDELLLMIQEQELRGVPIAVLANKQDLPEAMSEVEVTKHLRLCSIKNQQWAVFKCSARSGCGINEAMDWVVDKLKTS